MKLVSKFNSSPTASGPLGGCLPASKEEAVEEDELTLEGSISMIDEEENGGGANVGCAIYRGILCKGASRSKKGLKIEIVKGYWKNMYSRIYAWLFKYMESRAWL